jgi:DNA-binding protein HU-beta
MATSKQGGAKGAQSAPPKSKRMSQSAVLNHFAERFGLRRAQVKEIFDELAELAAKEVKRNEEFALPGLGKLVLARRKAREGRNPQTGEPIKIAAKTTLKFRLSKALKDTVGPAKKKN